MAIAKKIWNKNIQASLYDSEMSDVEFRIGNDDTGIQEFSGIRALFATQSDVLKRMLYGNMAESKSNNIVIIDDISPHTFDWFKKYCYGLNPRVTHDNIVNVLHICDKYCMKELYDNYFNTLLHVTLTNANGKIILSILNDLMKKGMYHVIDSIICNKKLDNLDIEQYQMITVPKDTSLLLPPKYIGKILFDSKTGLSQSVIWKLVQTYCTLVIKAHAIIQSNNSCNNTNGHNYKDSQPAIVASELVNVNVSNVVDTEDRKSSYSVDENSIDNCDINANVTTTSSNNCNGNNIDEQDLDVEDGARLELADIGPTAKRRHLINQFSNSMDNQVRSSQVKNTVNGKFIEPWVEVMQQYFLKYFDFVTMENTFFLRNVYCVKGLLTIEEKFGIFEAKLAMLQPSSNDNKFNFAYIDPTDTNLIGNHDPDYCWLVTSETRFNNTKWSINYTMRIYVDMPYDVDDTLRKEVRKLNKMRPIRHFDHVSNEQEKEIAKSKANLMFLWIKYWCAKCIDRKTNVPSFIGHGPMFKIFFKTLIDEYHSSCLDENLSIFKTRLDDVVFSMTEYQAKIKI